MTDFDREIAQAGLEQAIEGLAIAEAHGESELAEWERNQIKSFRKILDSFSPVSPPAAGDDGAGEVLR